jgi:hypothetical protein
MEEFEEEFAEDEELLVLSHDQLEQMLQNILAKALDEPVILSAWTIVTEVTTPSGAKYFLPITKDEQSPWLTKGLLTEALDQSRSEDTAYEVLERIASAHDAEEDDEEE